MGKPRITIIVPVYNAEEYLKRCVDSILIQTYSNIEIILVDDGSTDSCSMICDEYVRRDSRIKAIHKINGGVSSARNDGLKAATAEFVTFIDSDDYISEQYIENLMIDDDTEYVVSGFWKQGVNLSWEAQIYESLHIQMNSVRSNPGLINKIPMGMVWARRYKKSIIDIYHITFAEDMHRGEDVYFNSQYLSYCTSVVVASNTDYFYCTGLDSATSKFYPLLFEWSMRSVKQIGEIIGTDTAIYYRRLWNNAEYVYNDYFFNAKGKGIKVQCQMIKAVFGICKNKELRKSMSYAPNKKIKWMIRMYIFPVFPYLYSLYHRMVAKHGR